MSRSTLNLPDTGFAMQGNLAKVGTTVRQGSEGVATASAPKAAAAKRVFSRNGLNIGRPLFYALSRRYSARRCEDHGT